MDRAELQGYLERGMSLEAIGRKTGMHASTVGYWARKHGFESVYRARHAARGGIARKELESLIAEGLSTRDIAARLSRSQTTVRHWLRRYGLDTRTNARRAKAAEARRVGHGTIVQRCVRHGLTEFVLEARGSYRCLRCRSEWVSERRRKVKTLLVKEAGGSCALCGYDRHPGALQFHHRDPGTKSFSLSHLGVTRSLARCRDEAMKCVLLCANCHAEVEAGIVDLPR
jgi:transposase